MPYRVKYGHVEGNSQGKTCMLYPEVLTTHFVPGFTRCDPIDKIIRPRGLLDSNITGISSIQHRWRNEFGNNIVGITELK